MTENAATALLVSGRRPGIDPLAAHFGVADKALIEVAGETMLSRVARVLVGHAGIRDVVVLAQDPEALLDNADTAWMKGHPRISTARGGHSVSAAVAAAIGERPEGFPFIVTAADNVLLDTPTLDRFLAGGFADAGDIAVGLVARSTFISAYPEARRTWLRFRGGQYSGANLFLLKRPAAIAVVDFWRRVENDRKRASAIARSLGPLLTIGYALRLFSIEEALRIGARRFGTRIAPIVLPYPEACIDVDKEEDHRLATAIIEQRARGA